LFSIAKANQTISFAPLGDKTFGDADFGVSATASSGLTVAFSTVSSSCTVSMGGIVHIVSAGSCTITASQAGDTNYNAATSAPQAFTINKAVSSTVVSCPASVTYDGSAQTPCSVAVTGAGSLSLTPTPSYSNNTNAGTASASYTYAGDTNHTGSSGSKDFTIDKADSSTVVSCPVSVVYNGSARTPCTVAVTGAGSLSIVPAAVYANNVNAGTATASYTYAGDDNHNSSSDSQTFTIAKAASTTVVSCPANVTYDGSAQTPCSVVVSGAGGLDSHPTPSYSNNTNAGTATASYTFAGDDNHNGSSDSKTFTIGKASSTTTVKWLVGIPYFRGDAPPRAIPANADRPVPNPLAGGP